MPTQTLSPNDCKTIIDTLKQPYGGIYLACDDYVLYLCAKQHNMTLKILVYVNGYIKGEHSWTGTEDKFDTMPEIARRFYWLRKKVLYTAQERQRIEKVWGKREAKRRCENKYIYYVQPFFNQPTTLLKHLKKHNAVIRIIDRREHEERVARVKAL